MSAPARAPSEQAELFTTPKRGSNERHGIHAWFPYYAGYSSAFVEEALRSLSLRRGSVVFDPMNGSGTTTLVAQQMGFRAIGNELNPAMAILARAKDASLRGGEAGLRNALKAIRARMRNVRASSGFGPLAAEWFSEKTFQSLKLIEASLEAVTLDGIDLDARTARALSAPVRVKGGLRDLLMAALLVAVRKQAQPKSSKNPTWFTPSRKNAVSTGEAWAMFSETALRLQRDIDDAFADKPSERCVAILEGDARALEIRSGTVDAIVTSPPYLTRIDYAISTAPELVFLGYDAAQTFHQVRSSIMGSTCIVPGDHSIKRDWGNVVNRVLKRVSAHDSKASSTYYLKTHVQYFSDAHLLLRESMRVLRRGGAAFMVLQDSWYKDVHIPLEQAYCEMASLLGARDARVVKRIPVRTHMGLVNTRARKYRKGEIAEYVIKLLK